MAGWGSYQSCKKSPAGPRVEVRREFGKKYSGLLEELIALAAATKVKVKRLPCGRAFDLDDEIPRSTQPEPPPGPCQEHIQRLKAWRAKVAAGIGTAPVVEVDDRTKRLIASREYHRAKRAAKKAGDGHSATECPIAPKKKRRAKAELVTAKA
jgi:hypothetical protein